MKWISVKDRLPDTMPETTGELVSDLLEVYTLANINEYDDDFENDDETEIHHNYGWFVKGINYIEWLDLKGNCIPDVTHYRPLEPPEEE